MTSGRRPRRPHLLHGPCPLAGLPEQLQRHCRQIVGQQGTIIVSARSDGQLTEVLSVLPEKVPALLVHHLHSKLALRSEQRQCQPASMPSDAVESVSERR